MAASPGSRELPCGWLLSVGMCPAIRKDRLAAPFRASGGNAVTPTPPGNRRPGPPPRGKHSKYSLTPRQSGRPRRTSRTRPLFQCLMSAEKPRYALPAFPHFPFQRVHHPRPALRLRRGAVQLRVVPHEQHRPALVQWNREVFVNSTSLPADLGQGGKPFGLRSHRHEPAGGGTAEPVQTACGSCPFAGRGMAHRCARSPLRSGPAWVPDAFQVQGKPQPVDQTELNRPGLCQKLQVVLPINASGLCIPGCRTAGSEGLPRTMAP